MSDETGVNEPAAAEQEPLFTKEDFMDTGVEEPVAAEQDEVEEEIQEQVEPQESQEEAVEKAFAARLRHATDKIREEVKQELIQEMQQGQQTPQEDIPVLPEEEAVRLADQYGASPEMIRALYAQQVLINRQTQDMQQIAHKIREQEEYTQARSYADSVRAQNPNAPAWDEKKLSAFREDYQRQYGVSLSWRDTYRQFVAEEALKPETYQKIARDAQQETINKITARDKETVQVRGKSAKKRSVSDLTEDEFQRLVEDAKMGKFI